VDRYVKHRGGNADGLGNLVSVFFITQFFTSLLWSSIADKHGRRAVLVASLAVSHSFAYVSLQCQGSAVGMFIIYGMVH
jgi:MFS family permease